MYYEVPGEFDFMEKIEMSVYFRNTLATLSWYIFLNGQTDLQFTAE